MLEISSSVILREIV